MKNILDRDIAALLNPRLALLVTCGDQNGKNNILTIAWHSPLSHRPPLVGISVGKTRHSLTLIREFGEFVLNIVSDDLVNSVQFCGNYTGEIDDKFEITKIKTMESRTVHPPRLAEAMGFLECKVMEEVETGDHIFFVGKVLLAKAREDCFSNAWESLDQTALLCLQRNRFGKFMENYDSSNGK
ncbi:MAG: flavin reductase family protein [Anaerolineaceae bacterium]|nr:flavin reductase family protein [Anaerolineaceae bacterium]